MVKHSTELIVSSGILERPQLLGWSGPGKALLAEGALAAITRLGQRESKEEGVMLFSLPNRLAVSTAKDYAKYHILSHLLHRCDI